MKALFLSKIESGIVLPLVGKVVHKRRSNGKDYSDLEILLFVKQSAHLSQLHKIHIYVLPFSIFIENNGILKPSVTLQNTTAPVIKNIQLH